MSPIILPMIEQIFRACSSSKLEADHYDYRGDVENKLIVVTPLATRLPNNDDPWHHAISHPAPPIAPCVPVVAPMPVMVARQVTSPSSTSPAPSPTVSSSSSASSKLQIGTIVGIAIGSVILISLLFMILAAFRRRVRRARKRPQGFVPGSAFYAHQKNEPKSAAPDDHQYPPQIPMTSQPESGYFPVTTPIVKNSHYPHKSPYPTELEAGPVRSEWTS